MLKLKLLLLALFLTACMPPTVVGGSIPADGTAHPLPTSLYPTPQPIILEVHCGPEATSTPGY